MYTLLYMGIRPFHVLDPTRVPVKRCDPWLPCIILCHLKNSVPSRYGLILEYAALHSSHPSLLTRKVDIPVEIPVCCRKDNEDHISGLNKLRNLNYFTSNVLCFSKIIIFLWKEIIEGFFIWFSYIFQILIIRRRFNVKTTPLKKQRRSFDNKSRFFWIVFVLLALHKKFN